MANKTRHRRINPVARAPIMRKGGVHEKSRSAKRQADKRQLKKLVTKLGAGLSGTGHYFTINSAPWACT